MADLKQELSRRADIAHEQLELINRKLDEIQDAAARMGRKDWINYCRWDTDIYLHFRSILIRCQGGHFSRSQFCILVVVRKWSFGAAGNVG